VRAASFVLAMSLVSSIALADVDQLVVLHDGSRFRGTLVELVVNDHVTLKLATGEVRRFAWADVDKTEEVKIAAPPHEPAGVFVALEAPPGALLQRQTGTIAAHGRIGEAPIWTDACAAPCQMEVPGGTYRVAGSGFRGTNDLVLPSDGRVRIDARLGSSGASLAGAILAILGGTAMGVGVVYGVLGIAFVASSSPNPASKDIGVTFSIIGGVAGAIGLALLIPGVIVVSNNASHAVVVQIARATTTGLRF
jgi:hypothetical protein